MDGIAIIYERIEIGENQFAFKPIFVEEGTLDDDKLLFLSHNTVYPHVITNTIETKMFFGNFVAISTIFSKFGKEISLEQFQNLKSEHFRLFTMNPLIGYASTEDKIVKFGKCLPPKTEEKLTCEGLKDYLYEHIVAQDKAVEKFANVMYQNFYGDEDSMFPIKKHILLTGPKGTGKSTMFKLACDYLKKSYYKANITDDFSPKTASSIILEMLDMYDNVAAAENGILYVSDFKSKTDVFSGLSYDLYKEAYGTSLATIMEGNPITVTWKDRKFNFDTSNLIVVIEVPIEELPPENSNKMGFGPSSETSVSKKPIGKRDYFNEIFTDDMIKNIKCIVTTKEYTVEDIKTILRQSVLSPLVRISIDLKEKHNIDLDATESYIDAIAREIFNNGFGAESLEEITTDFLASSSSYIEKQVAKQSSNITLTKKNIKQ